MAGRVADLDQFHPEGNYSVKTALAPSPVHTLIPALHNCCVQLWRVDLRIDDELAAELSACLTEGELARANRFRFENLRRRFVAARYAMRQILGRHLNVAPGRVALSYGQHGKPFLADVGSGIHFNLAHSGDHALLALTRQREIGVDIEHIDPQVDVLGIARLMYSPTEIEALQATPPDRRASLFFTIWTRKEAYIKATGEGLSAATKEFSVWPIRQSYDGLYVQSLYLQPGVSAAIATSGPLGPVDILDFPIE